MRTHRSILVSALISVFLLGSSLYAQQEVTPDWYNPWANTNQVTTHASVPQVAKQKNQARNLSVSHVRRSRTVHAKRLIASVSTPRS